MICEIAPAKVNLTLEIIKKRNDGYHEIKSLMQTIDLCDMLTFWDNGWVQVIPEYNNLPSSDTLPHDCCMNYLNNNLVYKAALILKEMTGYSGGAIIELKKNIPSSAGLGGGSSDAAATLRGLNRLWELGLSMEELAEVGSRIGSDIPFFIYGGTCLSTGRGEVIETVESIQKKWLTIALLPMRITEKTKRLYSHITPRNFSDGSYTECFLNNICKNVQDAGNGHSLKTKTRVLTDDYIFNVFETVYNDYFEEFKAWSAKLNESILKPFHLSGSGPSIFYISDNSEEIIGIVNKLEEMGLVKYFAQTVP